MKESRKTLLEKVLRELESKRQKVDEEIQELRRQLRRLIVRRRGLKTTRLCRSGQLRHVQR